MTVVGPADGDREALARLLSVPEMAWFLERVRSRVVAAGGAELTGVVRLDAPTPEQRAAAVKLVGRPRRTGATVRIDLADVEAILRRGPWPAGLADAVVALTGPVVDRGAERGRVAAHWQQAVAELDRVSHRFPGLDTWWRTWCAGGGLKRVARAEAARLGAPPGPDVARQMVDGLVRVLDALPATGVPLAVFARQVVGDAHGLDAGRPLGRLAAAAVGVAFGAEGTAGQELSARGAWATAGIVQSNVASTVLALGLAGRPDPRPDGLAEATATAVEAMRTARAPVLLTLDQVRSGGLAAAPPCGTVHVCENPTVVEVVAARWAGLVPGPDQGPVLVCTSGQPSTAVLELLELLAEQGARCLYHGDFDWAGLKIARLLGSRVPWHPWRFTAVDYRAAAKGSTASLQLAGAPAESPWDPGLATLMAEVGLAIEEEAVVDLLAADLLESDRTDPSRIH